MKPSRKSPGIDAAVARAVDFEVTIADLARRSERRAWRVAMAAVMIAVILAAGIFYMLPLKEKVPYLVMADAYTGTSTVARLEKDFDNRSVTTSEAINRSNVAHFILARESYDLALMTLRDWTTVYTMSSRDVAAGYTTLHARNNPEAPFHLYGAGRAIRVGILSIVLIGGDADQPPRGATVRFQRSLHDKAAGATRPLDSRIATLEFTYKPNLKMDEKHRIENPLGFQVTSYRVDSDYAAMPPLAEPAFATAQVATNAAAGSPDFAGSGLAMGAVAGMPQPGITGPDDGGLPGAANAQVQP